jgi:hypothetical protein
MEVSGQLNAPAALLLVPTERGAIQALASAGNQTMIHQPNH